MRFSPGGRLAGGVLLLAVGIALGLAGCGPSSGTVTGKVTYNNRPLKGGNVTFVSPNGSASARIGEDGSYSLDKVPTGEAKISVETSSLRPRRVTTYKAPSGDKNAGDYQPPGRADTSKQFVAIPEKYEDPSTSGLTYKVQRGQQVHDIPLTQ